MSSVNNLLEFHFSHKSFSDGGKNIISTHLINQCEARIATLNAITRRIGNSLINDAPTKGIPEVYSKFITLMERNNEIFGKFDKRELRTLTYALTYKEQNKPSIFEIREYLKHCFSILNEQWRDRYISGLLDCFLSNWGSRNFDSLTLLSDFLSNKIINYKGSRSLYLSLKSNAKFFIEGKGDSDLGFTLALLGKPISEATKHLTLPDHWITYPYFSGVIDGYFEKSKNNIENILDDIAYTLDLHSSSTKGTNTNKIIVSKIICHNSSNNESVQNKIKDIAFKLVGDPGVTSNWRAYEGAGQKEIDTISRARDILNEWVTRQFINVFFEKCINDDRRKQFWLKYSKKISSFKVYGPRQIRRILKSDERIAEYVDGRFSSTRSNREVSAFIFTIDQYKFIEFSDPGYAFYAYRADNYNAPSLNNNFITSVDDFRDGTMPMLVYRKGYYLHSYADQGRLGHNDGDMKWEDVFSNWLITQAGINV